MSEAEFWNSIVNTNTPWGFSPGGSYVYGGDGDPVLEVLDHAMHDTDAIGALASSAPALLQGLKDLAEYSFGPVWREDDVFCDDTYHPDGSADTCEGCAARRAVIALVEQAEGNVDE